LSTSADQSSACTVLGRIIVHDRVHVEAKVLPRYFNHSSFASLRRQLNYFSFVRLGKGRQRESTYINENVVELDDILHLKRRSTTGNSTTTQANGNASMKELLYADLTATTRHGDVVDSGVPVLNLSSSFDTSEKALDHRQKRRRQTSEPKPTTVSPRSTSPVENHLISEDDYHSDGIQFIALDLTKPEPDDDFLAGCKNLLYLASKGWN
jgi:HSF-type DNA-binding